MTDSKDLIIISASCGKNLELSKKFLEKCNELKIKWIFKSCYDKDCRSSPNSFHGIGLEEGLNILSKVRNNLACQ